MMADGVNGLFSMRSESLVVWAFNNLQESERRARGCGGLWMGGCGEVGDRRARWKLLMRAVVEDIEACRSARLSFSLEDVMVVLYCRKANVAAMRFDPSDVGECH